MLSLLLLISAQIALAQPPNQQADPILDIAEQEMNRVFALLQEQERPAYWIGLGIHEFDNQLFQASNGTVSKPEQTNRRLLDIDLRVGDYRLDNTHPIIDGSYLDEPTHFSYPFPSSNDVKTITQTIYLGLDDAYRAGLRRLIKIEANDDIKVEREDQSADFTPAPNVIQHIEETEKLTIAPNDWNTALKHCSQYFLDKENIIDSMASLEAEQHTRWFLNTDGTRVRELRKHYRLAVMAQSIAEDGMELTSYEYIDLEDITSITLEKKCLSLAEKANSSIQNLYHAPVIEPFVGPAILHGRAAAVFFHEILGHRVEGSRLKDENDGQTLTDKVGEAIFPDFINITDDPTVSHYKGEDLNGHYRVDDEGSLAEKTEIVQNGVLKQFLMTRSPIKGFGETNGHARRQAGNAPVARQGNLFVSSTKSVSYPELKKQLIEEIIKQNTEFGLIFDDISGGFTFTGRTTPNSYAVKPVTVWKIYPDGREEMVRGVDLIGTPLLTFSRIIATSNREQIFNGVCGAESGWVPVSAIAPDILVKEIEVQRRQKANDLPPILPKPQETQQ